MKTISIDQFIRYFNCEEYHSIFLGKNTQVRTNFIFDYHGVSRKITYKYFIYFAYVLSDRLLAFRDINFQGSRIKHHFFYEGSSMGDFINLHKDGVRRLISNFVISEEEHTGFSLINHVKEYLIKECDIKKEFAYPLSACTLIMLLAHKGPILVKH